MYLTEKQAPALKCWQDRYNLSVVGTSGSGKTTLALHLALEHSNRLPVQILICTRRLQMHLDAYRKRLRELYQNVDCLDKLIKEGRLMISNQPSVPKDKCVLVIDEFQFEQYKFIPPEILSELLSSSSQKIFCSYCMNPLALQSEPPPEDIFDNTFKTVDLGVKYGHWLIR